MASPYTIRSRTQLSSPISNDNMFKTFEFTPRTSSRRTPATLPYRQQYMGGSKKKQEATARTNKTKAPAVVKISSLPEFSNGDVHSNSMHESSGVVEKFRRSDGDFEKAQQNLQNSQPDQSLIFVANSSERQAENKIDRSAGDEQDHKIKNRQRSHKNWGCCGVPYRKCHSSMQQKVVSVINKIKTGKDCHKEIETLIQKSKKVSIKELNNKYFVSGIQLICNLSLDKEHKNIFTPDLISKLNEGLQDLKNRILSQLDNTRGFQLRSMLPEQITFEKLELVKKAYKVLRKKLRSCKRQQVQNKALEAADWFIENKVNDICLFYGQLAQS